MLTLDTPWKRQPQHIVPLSARHRPVVLRGFIAHPFRRVGNSVFSVVTAAPAVQALGRLRRFTGSGGYIACPVSATSRPWTAIAYGLVRSSGASAICAFAEAPGNSTYDRSLSIGTSGLVRGYIYDGAAKDAFSSELVTVGVPFVAAAVSSGTGITAYLNGVPGTTVAASNAGFTGYTTAEFVCGYGGGATGSDGGSATLASSFDAAYVLLLDGLALSAAQLSYIGRDGWKVFSPQRRSIPRPAVGGGLPTLSAVTAINVTSSGFQPRVTATY